MEPPNATAEFFHAKAPFLMATESATERAEGSRAFDAVIARHLAFEADLPRVHSFYEVMEEGREAGLLAALGSMRAAGHPVLLWTYSPEKLSAVKALGVELGEAAGIVPRTHFAAVMERREIRYFSDLFRYAVLHEHGGLWMDTDVILIRPFPFRGDHFFNLQWRSGKKRKHFVCGDVIYARRGSRHLKRLYELAIDLFSTGAGAKFGDVGPKLLSDYIASPAGAELAGAVFSPMFFNSIDWSETDRFDEPLADLGPYLHDERVFGVHLWTRHNPAAARGETSLISRLTDFASGFPNFASLGHRHARAYDRLLTHRRLSVGRLMEIGGSAASGSPWRSYFPFADIVGAGSGGQSRPCVPRSHRR